jgi:hypothetical protein
LDNTEKVFKRRILLKSNNINSFNKFKKSSTRKFDKNGSQKIALFTLESWHGIKNIENKEKSCPDLHNQERFPGKNLIFDKN